MYVYNFNEYFKKYPKGYYINSACDLVNSPVNGILVDYFENINDSSLYDFLHYFGSNITFINYGKLIYRTTTDDYIPIAFLSSSEKIIIISYICVYYNINIGVNICCLDDVNLPKFIDIFKKYDNINILLNNKHNTEYYVKELISND